MPGTTAPVPIRALPAPGSFAEAREIGKELLYEAHNFCVCLGRKDPGRFDPIGIYNPDKLPVEHIPKC